MYLGMIEGLGHEKSRYSPIPFVSKSQLAPFVTADIRLHEIS